MAHFSHILKKSKFIRFNFTKRLVDANINSSAGVIQR